LLYLIIVNNLDNPLQLRIVADVSTIAKPKLVSFKCCLLALFVGVVLT